MLSLLEGYYKLSMDHSHCKEGLAMGTNLPSWHKGTCASAGYNQVAPGSFFGRKQYVKGGTQDLSHYHIPAWADPHYSSSGNDRNFG